MLKVAEARKDHGHVFLVAEVDGVLVFDGAARLNHSLDTVLIRDLHTIRKRKEGIRCHDSTLQRKAKCLLLLNSLLERIYPSGLTDPACQHLAFCGQNDGVGLGVFANFACVEQCLYLPVCWSTLGLHL